MPTARVKRSTQIPLLKSAALRLAERFGRPTVISGIPTKEVKLAMLNFCLTPMGDRTILEIWDESRGGTKVLNMYCGPDDAIELLSFSRGEWEDVLLASAGEAQQNS